jgi:hypothetical protein
MKVKTNLGKLVIKWRYSFVPVLRNGKPVLDDNITPIMTEQTECIASVGSDDISTQAVKRYYKDPQDKEEARKQSLHRVLKELFPTDKESRKEVWDAYINRKNPDRVL